MKCCRMRYTEEQDQIIKEGVLRANQEGKNTKVWGEIAEKIGRTSDGVRKHAMDILNTHPVRENAQNYKPIWTHKDNEMGFIIVKLHEKNGKIVIVISDMHIGNKLFDKKAFEKIINFCVKKNLHVICLGDIFDVATTTGKTAVFDDGLTLNEATDYARLWLGKLSSTGLLDVIVLGNHSRRLWIIAGFDVEQDLASQLKVPFTILGVITYQLMEGKTMTDSFSIGIHHGIGGGRMAGAPLNSAEKITNILSGCDCILVGHSHKLLAGYQYREIVTNGVVKRQRMAIAVNGSFLNYEGSYAEAMALTPSPKGFIALHLNGRNNDKNILNPPGLTVQSIPLD